MLAVVASTLLKEKHKKLVLISSAESQPHRNKMNKKPQPLTPSLNRTDENEQKTVVCKPR